MRASWSTPQPRRVLRLEQELAAGGTPATAAAQLDAARSRLAAAQLLAARWTALATRVRVPVLVQRLSAVGPHATGLLAKVPVLSTSLTALSVGLDIRGGEDPFVAVATGAATTLAGVGAAAGTAALLAGGTLAGIAGAPVLVPLAAGAAVAWGVGVAIDHADDIARAGGRVAGAAGSAAARAGDSAGAAAARAGGAVGSRAARAADAAGDGVRRRLRPVLP